MKIECIYYENKENLHFDSAEHIFPNGLGGIQKLPVDYVSKEANQYFSKLERKLFKGNSLLNFIRSTYLKDKETENLYMRNNDIGYLKNKKLYLKPLIIIDNIDNDVSVSMKLPEDNNVEKETSKILLELKKHFANNWIKVVHKDIESGIAMLICSKEKGKYKFKLYTKEKANVENIKKFFLNKRFEISDVKKKKIKNPQINAELKTDFDLYYKVLGKISLNLLAYKFGKSFVMKKDFKELKRKILSEKKIDKIMDYINFTDIKLLENFGIYNSYEKGEFSYICIIKIENSLVAFFSFFGILNFYLILLQNTELYIPFTFYFLDYKKKIEIFNLNEMNFLNDEAIQK